MRRGFAWLIKALSDRGYALVEAPVRNAGAFVFRKGVDTARSLGLLPRPRSGDGILVVNLTSHFGDGIMLLPLLEALHRANPHTAIDLACSRGVESLFETVPFLRRVFVAPLSSKPPLSLRDVIRRRLDTVRWFHSLQNELHPAVCLMPRWGDDLFGSLSLAYLIGSPVRIAYDSTVDVHQRSAPQRDRMITHPVRGGSGMHEPLRFLRVAQQGGLLQGCGSAQTDAVVPLLQTIASATPWEELRQRLQLQPGAGFVVFAPGASSPNKTWPAAKWIEAGRRVLASGAALVVLSGPSDKLHAEAIASALGDTRVHVVAGVTTLPESIALLSHADGFLGNDSGPGHAAGALGVPSVILFSSDRNVHADNSFSPQRVRPMGPYVRTLHPDMLDRCRGACVLPYPHCIAGISPEQAVEALSGLMQQKVAHESAH